MTSHHWTWTITSLTILACLTSSNGRAQTLRDVLLNNHVEVGAEGPTDVDRPITSYAFENAHDLFLVAYYWREEDSLLLPDTLRLSVFEKVSAAWTHAVLPRKHEAAAYSGVSWDVGSILQIHHTRQRIYLDTHRNPSAGTLLVLTRGLQPIAALNGWLVLLLPNDTTVYEHSVIHFAPTHSSELWTYEPRSGRNVKLYPTKPYEPTRLRYIETVRQIYAELGDDWFKEHNHHMDPEQFNSSVLRPLVTDDRGTDVSFVARFGDRDDFPSSTRLLDVIVVCKDIASATPRCGETELSALQRVHPDWSNLQILKHVVGR